VNELDARRAFRLLALLSASVAAGFMLAGTKEVVARIDIVPPPAQIAGATAILPASSGFVAAPPDAPVIPDGTAVAVIRPGRVSSA
jgi:hypothetical protein